MSLDLKSRIYKAQTVGNVEPIEHMIPYPNLRSLIDGQNIKYGQRVVYKDHNLTYTSYIFLGIIIAMIGAYMPFSYVIMIYKLMLKLSDFVSSIYCYLEKYSKC